MPHFKIVSRWDLNRVLYEGEAATLADLVGTAVEAGARLTGADLTGAYLVGADLAGARLARANLARANLAGAYLVDANLTGANLARANLARANLARANLAGAYLVDANLARANLARANLAGASLAGAWLAGAWLAHTDRSRLTLIGERPYFEIGPIGSRSDRLVAWLTDGGCWVRAGCWWGPLSEFEARIAEVYATGPHGDEYRAAVEMIKAHERLWTPDPADPPPVPVVEATAQEVGK